MSAARSLDEELESVIKRAARDPTYRQLLREDRAAALAQSDLCPAVQSLVMSVETDQLEKMIHRELEKPDGPQPRTRWGCIGAGAIVGGMLLFANSMTLGSTVSVSDERRACFVLRDIGLAQKRYKLDHGEYATLETLLGDEDNARLAEILERFTAYRFNLTLDGDSYTATAVHATRPKTRGAYVIDAQGEIRPLEPPHGER